MDGLDEDRRKVMQVLKDGIPRKKKDIAYMTGVSQSDTQWALEVLMRKGEVTKTVGGKWGLRMKEERRKEKKKRFGYGKLMEGVLDVLIDGHTKQLKEVAGALGISNTHAAECLSRLVKKGRVKRVSMGHYRISGEPTVHVSDGPIPDEEPKETVPIPRVARKPELLELEAGMVYLKVPITISGINLTISILEVMKAELEKGSGS